MLHPCLADHPYVHWVPVPSHTRGIPVGWHPAAVAAPSVIPAKTESKLRREHLQQSEGGEPAHSLLDQAARVLASPPGLEPAAPATRTGDDEEIRATRMPTTRPNRLIKIAVIASQLPERALQEGPVGARSVALTRLTTTARRPTALWSASASIRTCCCRPSACPVDAILDETPTGQGLLRNRLSHHQATP